MAITDLFKSERGFYALALLIGSTVLAALGHMSIEMWKEFNLYIFGIYAFGKTVTGTASLLAKKSTPAGASVTVTETSTSTSTATAPTPAPTPEPLKA